MGKCFVLAFMISLAMLFSGTAFAASLNITSNVVALPAQSNLSSNVTMLNLSLNMTSNAGMNITQINFTFNSTNSSLLANMTNLSICVYNNTISPMNLLGCNSSWNGTTNITSVNMTNLTVSNITHNTSILIVYEVFSNATRPMTISVFINSNTSIAINDTGISINGSFPIVSGFTEVRTVRASAYISPVFVDTNVTNQTFKYNVVNASADSFESVKIIIPQNFNLTSVVNWTYLKTDLNIMFGTGCSTNCTIIGNEIIISDYVGIRNMTIYFNANTNASPVNSMSFNSTLNGTNAHDINTTPASAGATNVTTKMLVNITNITSVKNAAFVNGTDYWEFNFTVNITEAVYGMIQFKMNNWTSASTSYSIALQNATEGNITYYATLRNASESISTSNKLNVTNDYNITQGVFMNATAAGTQAMSLRMVIPLGTRILSDWWTTYKILFRTQP